VPCDGTCGEAYGTFPGGDPRDFTPDPDCALPEELRNHAEACRRAKEEGGVDLPAAGRAYARGFAEFSMFGYGTYYRVCPSCRMLEG
jgi:hypothetical protein